MNPDYTGKPVVEWMNEMAKGELALTDFQRSRVWPDVKAAQFLKAVLLGRPTGTILLVESGTDLGSRPIQGNDAANENVKSLILDGQQRLTSLWQGLMGTGKRQFYIKVGDLHKDLQVLDVIHQSKDFQKYLTPEGQFSDNVIPIKILYDPPDHDLSSPERLVDWCEKVIPGDAARSGHLQRSIKQQLQKPLEEYKIWFAEFKGIDVDEAATIFVETNRSSVKVSAFDLAVAQAQQRSNIKLREHIQRFYKNSDRVKYYFHQNEEKWIPEIGDCILKIACLKTGSNGLPPKNGKFEDALAYLFKAGTQNFEAGTQNADMVESNLDDTLQFIEDNGVPTKDILPRIPPVYVIAALQDELFNIHPIYKSNAMKLLKKYLWRSFFSNRYEMQANDRLYEDFKCLRDDIRSIKQGDQPKKKAPIFKTKVIKEEDLCSSRPIKSKSPIGNAIMALSLNNRSIDWVTGETLTVSQIRRLEQDVELDRHHVFPRKALVDAGLNEKDPRINHALNIVLIRKTANIALGKREPALYLDMLKQNNNQLTDEMLKERIESHFVPYDKLVADTGAVTDQYEEYFKTRASVLWKKIKACT